MTLGVVGVSHHTAAVDVRERFAYLDHDVVAALERIRERTGAQEAVLLSTCNRTEVYLYPVTGPDPLAETVGILEEKAGPLERPARDYLYRRLDEAAVRHLFRVAAGLESLVTGEAEIQGQVREAYRRSAEAVAPLTGPFLSRLFQTALSVGGRVRAETSLGDGEGSVASVAVALARKIFGTLAGKRILILGAGQTSELVVEALAREGAEGVVVANRTYERACRLAERLRGRAIHMDRIAEGLGDSDILVASTAAPQPIVTGGVLRDAFGGRAPKPLLMIDLAIPRDVEPGLGGEPDVFLYNVDDLRRIVDENLDRRRDAVAAAEVIVSAHVREFEAWQASLEVVPVIRAVRERADEMRRTELERVLGRLPGLGESERAEVEAFSRRLLNKWLHGPTVGLRTGAAEGLGGELSRAALALFGIGEPEEERQDEDGKGPPLEGPEGALEHQEAREELG